MWAPAAATSERANACISKHYKHSLQIFIRRVAAATAAATILPAHTFAGALNKAALPAPTAGAALATELALLTGLPAQLSHRAIHQRRILARLDQ